MQKIKAYRPSSDPSNSSGRPGRDVWRDIEVNSDGQIVSFCGINGSFEAFKDSAGLYGIEGKNDWCFVAEGEFERLGIKIG